MAKYETFNLCYKGSTPLDLNIIIKSYINKKKRLSINGRSTVFQTDDAGSSPASRITYSFGKD